MSWILLFAAGLLEVVWASMLPATGGFTRPLPTSAFALALAGSMYLLARATDSIPLGTAYAVWVGIGALGASLVGMALHGEPASLQRLGFLGLLVVSILGLKLTH